MVFVDVVYPLTMDEERAVTECLWERQHGEAEQPEGTTLAGFIKYFKTVRDLKITVLGEEEEESTPGTAWEVYMPLDLHYRWVTIDFLACTCKGGSQRTLDGFITGFGGGIHEIVSTGLARCGDFQFRIFYYDDVTESHTHRSVSKPGAGGRCPRTGGGAPNRSCPPVRDRYGALVIAGQRKRRCRPTGRCSQYTTS